MAKNDERQLRCSFCGKPQEQVQKLIAGPNVFICDECVQLSQELIEEEYVYTEDYEIKDLPNPKEIKGILDDYVIKQDRAKRALAVAVYNHYKRVTKQKTEDQDVELQKSNILMLGPTGSGKTLLAQTLARLLDVPFAIADATSLTEAGYVGEDVENIILKLVQAADYDIEKAEKGIVYIDEIDKVSRKSDNPSITRDVSGEGVQQALLKILEGTVANVPPQGGRKHPHQDFIQIDTSDVLFIVGGAFDGIEDTIESRINVKTMGFGADIKTNEEKDTDDLLAQIQPEDLLKYGLIPEFIGRLPVIVTLEELDKDALMKILTEPKNALVKQYKELFKLDDVELEFEEEALDAIAEKAVERKIGARGLRSILEENLLNIMYEIPSRDDIDKCIIDKNTILTGQPKLILKDGTCEVLKLDEKEEESAS